MTKKIVLLPATLAQRAWEIIRARSDVEAIGFDMSIASADFHALLARADGVGLSLTRFGEPELKAGRSVQVVARHGVGYDMIDVPALTRARIPLLITGVANSPSVAEHALYLMLELAKKGRPFHAMVADNRWNDRMRQGLPIDLFRKTVLIVGFGKIGSRLARMCLALGMQVCVYDPYVNPETIGAAQCRAETSLNDALSNADFVSINCPKTNETTGMIAQDQFGRMKESAFIVNTARGGIINELALHTALTTGRIAGAGLDVLEHEPPDPRNPLLKLSNVVLAPHMAGVTRESLDRMGVTLVQNILSVIDGKPNLENVVNKEIYGHQ